MPCHDPYEREDNQRRAARLNYVTENLCRTCAYMEKNHPHILKENAWLGEWWEKHKAHDERVKAAKAKKARGEKLSGEELGLLWFED